MQMLYNSDNFVVVQFDLQGAATALTAESQEATPVKAKGGFIAGGGYEIVDKFAGKEIFIDGPIADGFRQGVEALMQADPSQEDLDEFISRYTVLAHAPVALH